MNTMSNSAVQTKGGTTSIKLGERKAALSQIAAAKSRTVHFLILEAVDSYLERETARMNFLQEAEASLKHYHETGLHVTQSEMDAWLNSLYTENELPEPLCHT